MRSVCFANGMVSRGGKGILPWTTVGGVQVKRIVVIRQGELCCVTLHYVTVSWRKIEVVEMS